MFYLQPPRHISTLPLFTERDTLDSFSQQRYGVLAHVKGTF